MSAETQPTPEKKDFAEKKAEAEKFVADFFDECKEISGKGANLRIRESVNRRLRSFVEAFFKALSGDVVERGVLEIKISAIQKIKGEIGKNANVFIDKKGTLQGIIEDIATLCTNLVEEKLPPEDAAGKDAVAESAPKLTGDAFLEKLQEADSLEALDDIFGDETGSEANGVEPEIVDVYKEVRSEVKAFLRALKEKNFFEAATSRDKIVKIAGTLSPLPASNDNTVHARLTSFLEQAQKEARSKVFEAFEREAKDADTKFALHHAIKKAKEAIFYIGTDNTLLSFMGVLVSSAGNVRDDEVSLDGGLMKKITESIEREKASAKEEHKEESDRFAEVFLETAKRLLEEGANAKFAESLVKKIDGAQSIEALAEVFADATDVPENWKEHFEKTRNHLLSITNEVLPEGIEESQDYFEEDGPIRDITTQLFYGTIFDPLSISFSGAWFKLHADDVTNTLYTTTSEHIIQKVFALLKQKRDGISEEVEGDGTKAPTPTPTPTVLSEEAPPKSLGDAAREKREQFGSLKDYKESLKDYKAYNKELSDARSAYLQAVREYEGLGVTKKIVSGFFGEGKAKKQTRQGAEDQYLAKLDELRDKQREHIFGEGSEGVRGLHEAMLLRRIQRDRALLQKTKVEGYGEGKEKREKAHGRIMQGVDWYKKLPLWGKMLAGVPVVSVVVGVGGYTTGATVLGTLGLGGLMVVRRCVGMTAGILAGMATKRALDTMAKGGIESRREQQLARLGGGYTPSLKDIQEELLRLDKKERNRLFWNSVGSVGVGFATGASTGALAGAGLLSAVSPDVAADTLATKAGIVAGVKETWGEGVAWVKNGGFVSNELVQPFQHWLGLDSVEASPAPDSAHVEKGKAPPLFPSETTKIDPVKELETQIKEQEAQVERTQQALGRANAGGLEAQVLQGKLNEDTKVLHDLKAQATPALEKPKDSSIASVKETLQQAETQKASPVTPIEKPASQSLSPAKGGATIEQKESLTVSQEKPKADTSTKKIDKASEPAAAESTPTPKTSESPTIQAHIEYEKGSSVERELQQVLAKDDWVKKTYALSPEDRGKVAHLVRLELEKNAGKGHSVLGASPKNINLVEKGTTFDLKLEKATIQNAVERVHPHLIPLETKNGFYEHKLVKGDSVSKVIRYEVDKHSDYRNLTTGERAKIAREATAKFNTLVEALAKDDKTRELAGLGVRGDIDKVRIGDTLRLPVDIFDGTKNPVEVRALESRQGAVGGAQEGGKVQPVVNPETPPAPVVSADVAIAKALAGVDTKSPIHGELKKFGEVLLADPDKSVEQWVDVREKIRTMPMSTPAEERAHTQALKSYQGMLLAFHEAHPNTILDITIPKNIEAPSFFASNLPSGVSPHVSGNVKDYFGSDSESNTTITLQGNAQNGLGSGTKGGIHVLGSVEHLAGYGLLQGGSIEIEGGAGIDTCGDMKGGTFAVHGDVEGFHITAFSEKNQGTIIWKDLNGKKAVIFEKGNLTKAGIARASADNPARAGGTGLPGIDRATADALIDRAQKAGIGGAPAPVDAGQAPAESASPALATSEALLPPVVAKALESIPVDVRPKLEALAKVDVTDHKKLFEAWNSAFQKVSHSPSESEQLETVLETKLPVSLSVNTNELPTNAFYAPRIPKGHSVHFIGNVGTDTVGFVSRGDIYIQGNAADSVAQSKIEGYTEITGNTGHGLGLRQNGGEIVVKGNTGETAGASMYGGTVEVFGTVGTKACQGMQDGTFIPHTTVASFDPSAFSPENNGVIYYPSPDNSKLLVPIFEKGHFTATGALWAKEGNIPGISKEQADVLLGVYPAQENVSALLSIEPEKTKSTGGRAVPLPIQK